MTEILHEIGQTEDGGWHCATENVPAHQCAADNVPEAAHRGHYRALATVRNGQFLARVVDGRGEQVASRSWSIDDFGSAEEVERYGFEWLHAEVNDWNDGC